MNKCVCNAFFLLLFSQVNRSMRTGFVCLYVHMHQLKSDFHSSDFSWKA